MIALLASAPIIAVVGYGIAGLGIAVLFPITLSVAPRFGGMSAGNSVAAVATLGYGGFLVGPPVIGLLADHVGLPLALGLVVLLIALIPPLAWMASRSMKAGHPITDGQPG
jgi:MFS family permease